MKTSYALLLTTSVFLGLPAVADAQSTSEQTCYRNSDGLRQCDYRTETADSVSKTRCVFSGGNHKCESDAPKSKVIYPPSIEHVYRNGKTINVIRGMPTAPQDQ